MSDSGDEGSAIDARRRVVVGGLIRGAAHEIVNPTGYVLANLSFMGDQLRRNRAVLTAAAAQVDDPRLDAALAQIAADEEELLECVAESIEGVHRVADLTRSLGQAAYAYDLPQDTVCELPAVVSHAVKVARMYSNHRCTWEVELPDALIVRARSSDLLLLLIDYAVAALRRYPAQVLGNRIRVWVEEGPVLVLQDNAPQTAPLADAWLADEARALLAARNGIHVERRVDSVGVQVRFRFSQRPAA